jgi:hypothetical protein
VDHPVIVTQFLDLLVSSAGVDCEVGFVSMSKAELKEAVTPSYKSKAGGIATGVEEFRYVSCFSFVRTLPALHSALLLFLLLFRLLTPQIGETQWFPRTRTDLVTKSLKWPSSVTLIASGE